MAGIRRTLYKLSKQTGMEIKRREIKTKPSKKCSDIGINDLSRGTDIGIKKNRKNTSEFIAGNYLHPHSRKKQQPALKIKCKTNNPYTELFKRIRKRAGEIIQLQHEGSNALADDHTKK